MTPKIVLDQWAELLAMIEAARPTTEHPDVHTCLDAMKQMAEEHSELIRTTLIDKDPPK